MRNIFLCCWVNSTGFWRQAIVRTRFNFYQLSDFSCNNASIRSQHSLSHAAVVRFRQIAREAIEARDQFTVALSGSSTSKALYMLLATEPWHNQIDWNQVHLFWGDERHVSPSDASSNFRMTQERLLSQVPIPPENVHQG